MVALTVRPIVPRDLSIHVEIKVTTIARENRARPNTLGPNAIDSLPANISHLWESIRKNTFNEKGDAYQARIFEGGDRFAKLKTENRPYRRGVI